MASELAMKGGTLVFPAMGVLITDLGLRGQKIKMLQYSAVGSKMRMVLVRALLYNPKVLLFDEPLSTLNAKLRDERMRLELINLKREVRVRSVCVTRDLAEAMVISDDIVVMN